MERHNGLSIESWPFVGGARSLGTAQRLPRPFALRRTSWESA